MNSILANITLILSILWVLTALFTIVVIILENRDPVKTVSWILVVLLIPGLGIVLYIMFGQYYRKQKIFSRKELKDLERIKILSQKQINDLNGLMEGQNDNIRSKSNIMMLLLKNSKALLTEYNAVNILSGGEETFDSIIEAIESATDHIHMEFYKWESDKIGERFREVLIKKASEGVTIRLIYDDVGSWKIGIDYIKSLKEAGIEIFAFMPVQFPFFTSKANYRNHRKIVVIDGKIGFVGGINIADKYLYGTKKLGMWRDTHLRIEGEAVHSLQTIFSVDWYFVSKVIIGSHSRYFPQLDKKDQNLIQITACGPDSDWASIMQSYFVAISSAKNSVYISTPYFSPNESVRTALHALALSGVEVKIMLPSKSDSTVSYWNSFSYIGRMLEAGIEVYLYERGFNHSKVLMVDGVFSSVGTANFDNRSFDLNFEVNALIYNEKVTMELTRLFEKDLKDCQQVFISQWKKRPLTQKIKESLSRMLGPLY